VIALQLKVTTMSVKSDAFPFTERQPRARRPFVYNDAMHAMKIPQSIVHMPCLGMLAQIHLHPSGARGVPDKILCTIHVHGVAKHVR
jgi:hypothetical protein